MSTAHGFTCRGQTDNPTTTRHANENESALFIVGWRLRWLVLSSCWSHKARASTDEPNHSSTHEHTTISHRFVSLVASATNTTWRARKSFRETIGFAQLFREVTAQQYNPRLITHTIKYSCIWTTRRHTSETI